MKIKKTLIVLLSLLILGFTLNYFNLCVSEKYETQLEGLNPSKIQLDKAKKLKDKIEQDKQIALFIILISIFAIYPTSMIKK